MSKATREPRDLDRLIGQRIRAERRALGLTQTDLASRLGVTFQQVQKYERGTNRVPASRLAEIASLLAAPLSYFLGDTPSSTSSAADPDTKRLVAMFQHINNRAVRAQILDLVSHLARAGAADTPPRTSGRKDRNE